MNWKHIAALSFGLSLAGTLLVAAPFAAQAVHDWQARPPAPGPATRYPMGFRHLGIADIQACGRGRYPIIERTQQGRISLFTVRAAVNCGLQVRKPAHRVQDGTLHLSYGLHLMDGMDACECEYRSVFAISDLPADVTRVRFAPHYPDDEPPQRARQERTAP